MTLDDGVPNDVHYAQLCHGLIGGFEGFEGFDFDWVVDGRLEGSFKSICHGEFKLNMIQLDLNV